MTETDGVSSTHTVHHARTMPNRELYYLVSPFSMLAINAVFPFIPTYANEPKPNGSKVFP